MEAITWLLIAVALLASEWLGASFDGLMPAAVAALLISVLTAVLPLAPGAVVVVMGRDGTRLQVLASKVEP